MADALRIGTLIKDLRKRLQMTQEELAHRTDRSVDAISQIERDINSPSVDTLIRIASALNVSASMFFASRERTNLERHRTLMLAIAELEALSDRDLRVAIRQLRAFRDQPGLE